MQDQTILETRRLSREFSGFVAVNNVSLKVRQGSIHGLIGPNGAGKTTVFNLLTKFLLPTSGTILYRGEDITRDHPARVARRGLARSFQISSTFPHMTLLENVRVALQRKLGNSFQFWRSQRSLAKLDERAMEILTSVELAEHAQLRATELPYGRKRALEFATTLALEPELMLLDEPTQGMAHEDVGHPLRWLVEQHQFRFQRQRGGELKSAFAPVGKLGGPELRVFGEFYAGEDLHRALIEFCERALRTPE